MEILAGIIVTGIFVCAMLYLVNYDYHKGKRNAKFLEEMEDDAKL